MEDLNVTHLCCLCQVGGSAGLLAPAAAVTSDLSANTAVRPAINVTMCGSHRGASRELGAWSEGCAG